MIHACIADASRLRAGAAGISGDIQDVFGIASSSELWRIALSRCDLLVLPTHRFLVKHRALSEHAIGTDGIMPGLASGLGRWTRFSAIAL